MLSEASAMPALFQRRPEISLFSASILFSALILHSRRATSFLPAMCLNMAIYHLLSLHLFASP
jgi:hypothetical protein